jgi:hypothetical protein
MSLIKLFLAENNSGISVFLDRGTLLRQKYSLSRTIYAPKVEVFLARKSLIIDITGFTRYIFNSAGYTDLPPPRFFA